jgi:DNA-binding response OmpR family regulator
LEHFSATGEFDVFLIQEQRKTSSTTSIYDIVIIDEQLLVDKGSIQKQLQINTETLIPFIILSNTDKLTKNTTSGLTIRYLILKKPFRFVTLLAKVRTEISRFKKNNDLIYRMGPYEFYPIKGLLKPASLINKKKLLSIELTEKETSILNYLLRSEGGFASRAELLEVIWGYKSGITTHTLETHIYRLREKLKPKASKFISIKTSKDGYSVILQAGN